MPARKSYAEQLKDPRWQKKRLEILERDGWECQRCTSTEKTLHVHHTYYERGKMAWDYDGEFLLTICEECHEAEQVQLDFLYQSIGRNSHLIDQLIGYIAGSLIHRADGTYGFQSHDFSVGFADGANVPRPAIWNRHRAGSGITTDEIRELWNAHRSHEYEPEFMALPRNGGVNVLG